MKAFLVTGAGGFIGGHLARELQNAGCRTLAISHSKEVVPNFDSVYSRALGTSIADLLNSEAIEGMVHGAYAAGGGDEHEYRVNVDGTIRWAEEALRAGVRRQILLSSLSARENVSSTYGRAKREIEKWFLRNNLVVFRLGLVIGDGGIFKKMMTTVQKYPLIPLLDNGSAPIYPLSIVYLRQVVRDTLLSAGDDRSGRIWHLQQPQAVCLREVLSTICHIRNQRRIFVPIPSGLVLHLVEMVEKLPIKVLPISATNIRGLRAEYQDRFPSDFERFGHQQQSLAEMIRAALEEQC